MGITHVHKAPSLGLVVQEKGVGNNKGLLREARHLHHNKVKIGINMGKSSLSKSISHIVDSIRHVGQHQYLFLSEISLFLFPLAVDGTTFVALLPSTVAVGAFWVGVNGGPSTLIGALSVWFCPKASPDPSAYLPVAKAFPNMASISV
jgi:hypothetical protein